MRFTVLHNSRTQAMDGVIQMYSAWKASVLGVFLFSIFPHSNWMLENTDQKNSEYGRFSLSGIEYISEDHLSSSYIWKPLFCKKGVLNTCERVSLLIKKGLWIRYFPVNFATFLKTPFLQNNTPLPRTSSKTYKKYPFAEFWFSYFMDKCDWEALKIKILAISIFEKLHF